MKIKKPTFLITCKVDDGDVLVSDDEDHDGNLEDGDGTAVDNDDKDDDDDNNNDDDVEEGNNNEAMMRERTVTVFAKELNVEIKVH